MVLMRANDPLPSPEADYTSRAFFAFGIGTRAADFNCDDLLDIADYLEFAETFGGTESRSDFNRDGLIDFFDYMDFVNALGTRC